MKRAFTLIALLLLGSLAVAQTLEVKVDPKVTTLTLTTSIMPGKPPLPTLVFLGIATKEGSTQIKFPVPFLPPMVFGLEDAMILPLGVLDRNGKLVVKIPFGSEGPGTPYTFFLQAGLLVVRLNPMATPPIGVTFAASKTAKAEDVKLPR